MATKNSGTKSTKKVSSESHNPNEMKTTELKDLIDFIAKSGLNEVDVETKELKIHVKRERDQQVVSAAPVMAAPIAAAPAQVAPAATPASAPATKTAAPAAKTNTVDIKSPMIGTFYRSSNPDSPPFASVGDKVSKGQVVCIIEAMKLFNEIESEVSGTITKVMVENSSPVEYDQVLFVVEPD